MIILTFCSEEGVKIPQYTYYCIKALRHYNPDMPIHFLARPNHGFEKVFRDLDVEWFDYSDYSTNELESFRATCDLKKHGTPNTAYPSPPNFFYGAMERMFVIQAHQEKYCINNFFHLENDVLVYYPMECFPVDKSKVEARCPFLTRKSMTLAVSSFNGYCLKSINNKILEYIKMGEIEFCRKYDTDMLNEMTCLYAAYENNLYIEPLNILPYHNSSDLLFDPGSYGQYLGGTNNEHGPGWAGDHHLIGQYINNKTIKVTIIKGKPVVQSFGKTDKLFNLHIHSKNLKDFIDV